MDPSSRGWEGDFAFSRRPPSVSVALIVRISTLLIRYDFRRVDANNAVSLKRVESPRVLPVYLKQECGTLRSARIDQRDFASHVSSRFLRITGPGCAALPLIPAHKLITIANELHFFYVDVYIDAEIAFIFFTINLLNF